MSEKVPSRETLTRLRSAGGANSPLFLPASRHSARTALVVGLVGVFGLFGALVTYYAATEPDTGLGFAIGAGLVSAYFCFMAVRGYRLGVVLDRGRLGVRHPLRPGTVWLDLGRVELAVPIVSIGYNLAGSRRKGKRYYGPGGLTTSLTLWSRGQGFRSFVGWLPRVRMRARQRRIVRAAETHLGRLRPIMIEAADFEVNSYAAILVHLHGHLRPHQAEQIRDIDEYAAMLMQWAVHGFAAGGRHRRDWSRDPTTLTASDLNYGPGTDQGATD